MKTTITYLLIVWSMAIHAQQALDTIFANDQMNVALFFPNPIRQGITGTNDFAFTYNREKEQYFGLLQANPGETSNLLAITRDGNVYSYILKYSKSLSKLNYFIQEYESIGNEKPKTIDALNTGDTVNIEDPKNHYYKRFSEYLLKTKSSSIASKRQKGIVLKLLKMVYNKDEVYLVMEIVNNSGIDFEIDYLNVSIAKGNKRHKASSQNVQQEVFYKYNMPRILECNELKKIVLVLSKFVLSKREKLHLELKELNGNRGLIVLNE
ncbi:DUF4138 domain-containing protein [Mariniflexile sp. HNIBRBA6329]|uniref:DUF4138 domain-containing protein n=1 Tax=Mariniflexile sp. HNIBRBA6329 TaxID=3373088 RepID=UPI0037473F0D